MSGTKHYLPNGWQAELDKRSEALLDNIDSYSAGLFLNTNAKTPELKNLKSLGLPRLKQALIVAEVMAFGGKTEQSVVAKLYSENEIQGLVKFADDTLARKQQGVNKTKRHRYTETEGLDPDELEEETYDHDGEDTTFEDDEMPLAKRPRLE